jgi:hypothetical protein
MDTSVPSIFVYDLITFLAHIINRTEYYQNLSISGKTFVLRLKTFFLTTNTSGAIVSQTPNAIQREIV